MANFLAEIKCQFNISSVSCYVSGIELDLGRSISENNIKGLDVICVFGENKGGWWAVLYDYNFNWYYIKIYFKFTI